jgi:hypothetical protein
MGEVLSLDEFQPVRPATGGRAGKNTIVFFDRQELDQILQLYSRMVMLGEWHDYAMSHGRESATFAIFHRASSGAAYHIVKQPKLARKQGAYALIGGDGRVLKRGHELTALLSQLNRKSLKLV